MWLFCKLQLFLLFCEDFLFVISKLLICEWTIQLYFQVVKVVGLYSLFTYYIIKNVNKPFIYVSILSVRRRFQTFVFIFFRWSRFLRYLIVAHPAWRLQTEPDVTPTTRPSRSRRSTSMTPRRPTTTWWRPSSPNGFEGLRQIFKLPSKI